MKMRFCSAVVLAVCLTFVSGCGSGNGLIPVRGRVLLDDQPIEGAAVMFQPVSGGLPATATTGANGEFELETSQAKGATAGENKVSVAKQVAITSNRKTEESEIVPMKSLTPPKYASPQTSGLSVDVQKGMKPVELKLISK